MLETLFNYRSFFKYHSVSLAMRFILLYVVVFYVRAFSQEYQQIKNRFDAYLNYHQGLNNRVEITQEKITLYDKDKKPFVFLKKEWSLLAKKNNEKGNLIKIMIDPGHIAGTMDMARIEQKFLHFTRQAYPHLKRDSLDIAEGILTFQTAYILKKMLETKGFEVALTRQSNSTSFGCTYQEWIEKYKKKVLDSLLNNNQISLQKHNILMKENEQKFFIHFFKEYELKQRALIINNYKPDITIIIHYNVDEKNTDWKKPSDKNFCMTFVPGCITPENLATEADRTNFIRLLLSNHIDESQRLSYLVVQELSKQLNLPIAKKTDATYLSEHCVPTPNKGVYARNLALCRMVQSPLVYAECLYQDNESECYPLSQNNDTAYGIKTNQRVQLVARAFFNAVMQFYNQ
ncbi:MAG: N-acetylmuramoyl-L-alanine amidase [Bacteroidetes bacterium]|nr:N-acetylmuramoyl-L-alanine amidase [Bacteroidota bacterium]